MRASVAVVMLVAAVASAAETETPVPVGERIHVSSADGSRRLTDAVAAADAQGNFVVAWESYDGSVWDIRARRYDASGRPRGPEFRVNTMTTGWRHFPVVASDRAGNFLVAWTGRGAGDAQGIFARRFDPTGEPLGPEFRVNTYVQWSQVQPSVAADASGRFVVAWSGPGDGDIDGIFARLFDGAGQPIGGDFLVNTYTTGGQAQPAVAADASGRFVVAWYSYGPDGDGSGIAGRRFAETGEPWGPEFLINTDTTGNQREPSAAMAADGGFLVAWTDRRPAPSEYTWEIYARAYDGDGNAAGPAFHVNSYTTGLQWSPSVTADGPDSFVVLWPTEPNAMLCIPELPCPPPPDPSEYFGTARRYRRDGLPLGEEVRVASCTSASCEFTRDVAGMGQGHFVVAGTLGEMNGVRRVFAQRYGPPHVFGDGFESQSLAAWSRAAASAGDLAVTPDAAQEGSAWGLHGTVRATGPLYVEDTSPRGETRYRARFAFDPRDFDPGEAEAHFRVRLLALFDEAPVRRLAVLVVRRRQGVYELMASARLDNDSRTRTAFVPISAAPQVVELRWSRASAPGANDGSLALWVDGALVSSLPDLPNSRGALQFVRLGALAVKSGATGSMCWDEFDSWRTGDRAP
jgi:hypothetical protein